ncbi:MAG TPA: hypothetical protein VF829_00985 [Candidatus Paceibacterota bacterium]
MKTNGDFKNGFMAGFIAGMAGAYAIYQNRRRIKFELWKMRARAQVSRRMRFMRRITRQNYERAVDDALSRLGSAGEVSARELDAFADELKRQYEHVRDRIGSNVWSEDDEEDGEYDTEEGDDEDEGENEQG